jgi:ABC-type uncharacterized transport system auxiliary subunit
MSKWGSTSKQFIVTFHISERTIKREVTAWNKISAVRRALDEVVVWLDETLSNIEVEEAK